MYCRGAHGGDAVVVLARGLSILPADSLKTFIERTQERLCTNSLNVTNLKMLISNLKRRGLPEGQDGRQGWTLAG